MALAETIVGIIGMCAQCIISKLSGFVSCHIALMQVVHTSFEIYPKCCSLSFVLEPGCISFTDRTLWWLWTLFREHHFNMPVSGACVSLVCTSDDFHALSHLRHESAELSVVVTVAVSGH